MARTGRSLAPRKVHEATFTQGILVGSDVDLARLPIQALAGRHGPADHAWAGRHARPAEPRQNVAFCRMQVIDAGRARRIMTGVCSYLRQFTYTRLVIVVVQDAHARGWAEVLWAVSTYVDRARDSLIIDNTPIDYLDLARQAPGVGYRLGLDTINKWPGATTRNRGKPITLDTDTTDALRACGHRCCGALFRCATGKSDPGQRTLAPHGARSTCPHLPRDGSRCSQFME